MAELRQAQQRRRTYRRVGLFVAVILVFVLILFILAKDDLAKWYHRAALRMGRERPVFAANAWQRWNFGEMSI